MALFIPKRVFVKKECHLAPRTKLIIENIKKYNPNVEINYLNGNYRYPAGLDPKGKFDYSKETVIIGERVEDFIRTFDSPGDIVEHFVTVLNTSWMCAYECQFCYLQNTRPPEHLLYTNFHKLDRELETSSYADTANLTMWSLLSFAARRQFVKLPEYFMETSDWLRAHFVDARINSDEKAIRSLIGKQKNIYKRLDVKAYGVSEDQFIVDRERIEYLYRQNKKFPLWLNASEFQDPAAVEHLTGSIEHLLKLLPKFKELRIKIRTRSNNFDVLTRYPLFNRVQALIDIDPQTIIDRYEPGTATLEERIELLHKLQKVDGLALRIILEPVFYYKDWDKEYIEMLQKVFSKVNPERIELVTIGFPRYRAQLRDTIKMHYPGTTLFAPEQNLQEPESVFDARYRYSYERRLEMFKIIKGELDRHKIKNVVLNSENPRLWDMVGFDKMAPIRESVYQYSDEEMATTEIVNESNNAQPENENSDEDDMAYSLEYQSAYSFIQNEEEEIDDIKFDQAEKYLTSVVEFGEEGLDELKWTTMYSIRISEALNGKHTWNPIKLVGFLTLVEQPSPLEINGEDVSLVHFKLTDLDGDTIDCLRIPYDNIQPHLDRMRTSRQLYSLLGTIVSVNISKRKSKQVFRFYIKKISNIVSADDMIPYRPNKLESMPVLNHPNKVVGKNRVQIHIDQPFLLISKIKNDALNKGINGNQIIQHIKEKLATELKIKGLGGVAHQLGMAIELAILQSLSQDREDYSYKLHSLIIGPPNVGKGFIPRIAKILNPIFDELPSNSPKLTSAGLVAKVIKGKSIPGVFPNTSGGTVAIQDFHEVRGNKRKELFSIFSKMMEDGEVLDKTSGNTVHEAIVSLHLDTNRYSQVYRDQEFNSFQDLNIPMNMFSRFDFIMEIPKDAERQKEISLAIAGAKKLGNRSSQKSLPDWARELKMIIAFLRTQYDNVNISEKVGNYIKQKLIAAIKPYEGKQYFADNNEDMQNRVSFSVYKFVKAIACANMQIEVSKEHVDYAFQFIDEKIKFIAGIDPNEEHVSAIISGDDPTTRKDMIAKEFNKKEFTMQEVLSFIKPKMTREIDERTIRRDLTEMGAKIIKKGIWSFIPQRKKR